MTIFTNLLQKLDITFQKLNIFRCSFLRCFNETISNIGANFKQNPFFCLCQRRYPLCSGEPLLLVLWYSGYSYPTRPGHGQLLGLLLWNPINTSTLHEMEHLVIDRTWKSCPSLFTQLFIIHSNCVVHNCATLNLMYMMPCDN